MLRYPGILEDRSHAGGLRRGGKKRGGPGVVRSSTNKKENSRVTPFQTNPPPPCVLSLVRDGEPARRKMPRKKQSQPKRGVASEEE